MFIKLQFKESIFSTLQREATNLQISIEELIHRFVDVQLGSKKKTNEVQLDQTQDLVQTIDGSDDEAWNDEDDWIDDDWNDEQVLNLAQPTHIRNDDAYWEQIYAEMREIDPEHEANIERNYGTGHDLLQNTAGIWGKSL